tara:strand:- start:713 stop:820 length:108 start_codon:yes stop_codon:yes gene_type:complete
MGRNLLSIETPPRVKTLKGAGAKKPLDTGEEGLES